MISSSQYKHSAYILPYNNASAGTIMYKYVYEFIFLKVLKFSAEHKHQLDQYVCNIVFLFQ